METAQSSPDPASSTTRKRKRVRHACDNCKIKKDRCNGQQPCLLCHKRNHSCQYSSTAAKDLSRGKQPYPNGTLQAAEAPVPSAARFISDSSGRYNYIGDSASLSFLESARLVAASCLGDCDFTSNDILLSVATTEPRRSDAEPPVISTLTAPEAVRLANEYLTATGCLLDLFDNRDMVEDVRQWAASPGSPARTHESLILLVLCIGMQMDSTEKAGSGTQSAYFERGRQLVYSLTVDEPSLMIVQAFALISMYLLADSRANSAFMNLGIAIRAAETLGLHKVERQCFSDQEASARERTWRSVRVLDIFLSASTGRPPATSDLDVSLTCVPIPNKHATDQSFAAATLGLCAIGERILIDVYKARSISTACVESISRSIREWVSTLPPMPAALVTQTLSTDHLELAREMASAHLMGAYYWAIILLTRPFLLFQSSIKQAKGSVVATLAETCIVAAINGLDLVEDVLSRDRLPRRLPVILNSVLNCALAVGVAIFADYDEGFPLDHNLARAVTALETLKDMDPSALQHLQTVQSLAAAAKRYKARRQERMLSTKCKQFDKLFGGVNSRFISSRQRQQLSPLTSRSEMELSTTDLPLDPLWFEEEFATLFPSGLLLGRSNRQTPEYSEFGGG